MQLTTKQKKVAVRIVVAAVCVLLLNLFEVEGWLRLALFLGVYAIIGGDIVAKAFRGIMHGRVFDENFLMLMATVGAFALAIVEGSGDYNEAIAVMLFYQIGEFFQSRAVAKSRDRIMSLMDIRPDYANIEKDGAIVRVDPDDIEVGQTIIVQPGEKVPIDGIVTDGTSDLNMAALTGESALRSVAAGDEVPSGAINLTGVIRLRTTRCFDESTASKILELVEESAMHKAQSEDFIARFARVYTPVVCYCAIALAVVTPLLSMLLGYQPMWATWAYRALTFLVISCPCALVISIPLTFFASIGNAGRNGILVKGSNIIERLARVRTVALDKTGTLTSGELEVYAIHDGHDCDNNSQDERDRLIELAALAECSSSHPISKNLRRAYAKPIDHSRVSNIKDQSGLGVTAVVDGMSVAVGNDRLMDRLGVECCQCHSTGTIIHVAVNNEYAGHIVMSDSLRPDARLAVDQMRHAGVNNVVMMTGDAQSVGKEIASQLGIDTVHCQMLPDDKVKLMDELLAAKGKTMVAYAGDGINDAPVITRADVGIAMGGLGSDAAIEAADVVLMDDNPAKISLAMRISHKCMAIVWQNIIAAIGIKLVCLVMGAFGTVSLWLAVFADVGVMILAVLNAMRALRVSRNR